MPYPSRRERGLIFVVAAATLLVVFALRTTGIHCDENNYLYFALRSSMGDARLDGKPPLFYAVNYLLSNSLGFLLGPNRYWSACLGYLLFNAYALTWLAARLPLSRARRVLFTAIALLSPLCLLNATQLMMESPMLALECFLLGAVLPVPTRAVPRWVLPWTMVLLVMAKDSGLPALVAVAGALWFWDRRRLPRYAAWVVGAAVIAKAIRVICKVKEQWYGGISTLLQISHWPQRAAWTGAYLQTWIFFVGPLLMIAALLAFRRARGQAVARGFFAAGALTLAGTLAVQFGVVVDFARYLYPLLWIGVLAWAALVVEVLPPLYPVLVAVGMLAQSGGLVSTGAPLRGWPAFVVDEMTGNYLTVLPGFALRGWTLGAQWRERNGVCLRIEESDAPARERFEHYFVSAFPGTRVFQSAQLAEFTACDGPKVTVERNPTATCDCSKRDAVPFRKMVCSPQDLKQMGPPAVVRNVVCLP